MNTAPMDRERQALVRREAARLSAVRMQMLDQHPFWGHLLLRLRLEPAPELASFAATDCLRTIWYNPLWTRHLALPQLGFVLAHEVGHHLLASLDRARGRDPHLWNCATDYAINRIVAAIPAADPQGGSLYQLPDGDYPGIGQVQALHDPRFAGMTAEAIYEHLVTHAPPMEPRQVQIQLPADPLGQGAQADPTVLDHRGGIDLHLPLNLSEDEREELQKRLREALEAWDREGRRGAVPGEFARSVNVRRPARVPWQRLLARAVGQALTKEDYSLAHPQRRYLAEDLLVPGLRAEALGEVVVAVDTSGSMSSERLGAMAAELASLHGLLPDLTVLVADAKVHHVVRAAELPAFLKTLQWRGGGGTSHVPVFAWVAQQRWQPELLIAMTDLFTTLPERRPPYPVLWLVPPKHGQAPWGAVVEVE